MKLEEGRLPMTEAESASVDALLLEHGPQGSLTRDRGLLVVEAGGRTWTVAADGKVS